MQVMFICTGNICRSAIAHRLLEKRALEENKDIHVYSSGTEKVNGWSSTEEAIEVMKKYDIDLTTHRSTFIRNSPIEKMDLILCMTSRHEEIVSNAYPKLKDKIYTLKKYLLLFDENTNIKDPYGEGIEEYQDCAEEIARCIEMLLNRIPNKDKTLNERIK